MISEEDKEFVASILGDLLDDQAFAAIRKAAFIATVQDALASLLFVFDSYCSLHGIRYFLFGDSLRGATHYEDFIPGASSIQLGMTFSEYEKLRRIWHEKETSRCDSEHLWTIRFPHVGKKGEIAVLPHICSLCCFPVEYKGKTVFGDDSFPLEVRYPEIELTIFDAVPDEFLVRKSFFRQTRRWSKVIERTVAARSAFAQRKSAASATNLAYAAIPLRYSMKRLSSCATRYEGLEMNYCACVRGSRSKEVLAESLKSLKRSTFHGMRVWVPENDTPWISYSSPEAKRRLQEVQSKALEVAAEIHRVCTDLGIGYFICGGTLLGSVRHGGFIPWDDDIDIGMLRADYQKFLECAPRVIDGQRFFLQTRKTDPEIPYLYSKVRMNGTFYPTEYSRFREFHQGIGVDLFPFDDLPNEVAEQRELLSKARAAARRHALLAFHHYPLKHLRWDASKRASIPGYSFSYIVGRAMACHYKRRSLSASQAAYEKLVWQDRSGSNGVPSEYVGCFVPTYTMVKRSDLLPYKKVAFSGVMLWAPANPDAFLSMQYGDYQQVPPPHQRFGHGIVG